MTAVRIGIFIEPGKITDCSDVRPPTDVMAITSLPHAPANHPVSGPPLSDCQSRHLPPENGFHKKGQHVVLSLP
jgi:hypothetical protein